MSATSDLERPDFRAWVERICATARANGTLPEPRDDGPPPDIRRDANGRCYVRLPVSDRLSACFPAEAARDPQGRPLPMPANAARTLGYERGLPTLPPNGIAHLVGPGALAVGLRYAADLSRVGGRDPIGYVTAAALPGEFAATFEDRPEKTLFVGEVGAHIGRARLHHVVELVLRMRATRRCVVLLGDAIPALGPDRGPEWVRLDDTLTRYGARRAVCP